MPQPCKLLYMHKYCKSVDVLYENQLGADHVASSSPRSHATLPHGNFFRSCVLKVALADISVDYWSNMDRVSVDSRPVVDLCITDASPAVDRYIWADIMVDYYLFHQEINVQPLVHYWSIVDWYISTLSANILPEATYSTHDPFLLPLTEHSTVAPHRDKKCGWHNLVDINYSILISH